MLADTSFIAVVQNTLLIKETVFPTLKASYFTSGLNGKPTG